MSSRSYVLLKSAANCLMLLNLDRSRGIYSTCLFPVVATMSCIASAAFSAPRHAMTTLAPRAASSLAVSRPMPWFPPVTRAIFPSSLALDLHTPFTGSNPIL
ncbi:hypothetical protein SFRURICE_017500 [Spodoptera frugiperda]|nr:hypothetical protein SFRURICE_017500 [Spodoptera frugiperda]